MSILEELNTNYRDKNHGMMSITRGVVKDNWDSKNPGKVMVEIFLGETGKSVSGWIPVMTPYGGKDYGYYALPEVGSEVVVGFNLGDKNCPIVLGCLWNNTNPIPTQTADEKNTVKRLKTKGGCEISFDEEDKKEKIEILTPGKLQISLEDENKKITIKDEKGKSSLILDTENSTFTISVEKKIDFKIKDTSVLTIDSNGVKIEANKVEIKGKQALNIEGQNTTIKGGMINAKASSTMSLRSSAMLEIKGTMVKIN